MSPTEYNSGYIRPVTFPDDNSKLTPEYLVPHYEHAKREMERLYEASTQCNLHFTHNGKSFTCDIGQRYYSAKEFCIKVERWFSVFATPEQRKFAPI